MGRAAVFDSAYATAFAGVPRALLGLLYTSLAPWSEAWFGADAVPLAPNEEGPALLANKDVSV